MVGPEVMLKDDEKVGDESCPLPPSKRNNDPMKRMVHSVYLLHSRHAMSLALRLPTMASESAANRIAINCVCMRLKLSIPLPLPKQTLNRLCIPKAAASLLMKLYVELPKIRKVATVR
mmetsp:Transcript_7145/g.14091  ORF Transcript_7145/g.14091 Transcript_7145/m.14091 type:complete len:118 (-) Transcript_7145:120-473(-)